MISPTVSVIIPVRDSAGTVGECVRALRGCGYGGLDIIVVDDGSSDESAAVASKAGARVIKCEGRGVSAARNTGAWHAKGDFIVFTDADVYFNEDTMAKLMERFRDPAVDGAVGVFTRKPCFGNFASVYKNAWMRFTYERLKPPIALFFTSIAAIRKDVFIESGGFDESYVTPGVEDTELGRRLASRGARIVPCADAEARHCKKYTVASLLITDFKRAAGLVRLRMKELAGRGGKLPGGGAAKLSAPARYAAGALAATFSLALLLTSLFYFLAFHKYCIYSIYTAAGLMAVSYLCAAPFLFYILKTHGIIMLLPSVFLYPVDGLFVTAGALLGAIVKNGK